MRTRHGAQPARHERVASLLQRQLSMLLLQGDLPVTAVADNLVSVVRVEVDPCLGIARIYIGSFNSSYTAEVVAELNNQIAVCRRRLAACAGLRRMPELRFFPESKLHRAWRVVPPTAISDGDNGC